jgi:predicted DNA-binding transcriptional regulator AlpA
VVEAALWRELADYHRAQADYHRREAERLAAAASALRTPAPAPTPQAGASSWRERFWKAPDETRIGVRELAEALGKSRSWIYHRTARDGERIPLPSRTIVNGKLEFVVGEVRAWLAQVEIIGQAGVGRRSAASHTNRPSGRR